MLPELGKHRVTWGYLKGRQRSHNPKVAGSNPAPPPFSQVRGPHFGAGLFRVPFWL